MLTLVRRVRRRLFLNALMSQGANAVSAAMAVFILLLVAGTQILNWQWLVAVPVTAALAGYWLARRRLPSLYVVAQVIDHRLGLADTISTAVYFDRQRPAASEERIRQFQLEAAQRASTAVDPKQAVPYSIPRSAYPMAALVLVASSLFGLRYGLSRRLDLRPPLARILQDSFGFPARTREAKKPAARPPMPQPAEQDQETTLEAEQALPEDQKPDPEESALAQTPQSDRKNGAECRTAGPGRPRLFR